MFSYVSPEQRVPRDHPLQAIRAITDPVLQELSGEFDRLYAVNVAPQKLLRALFQVLHTIRASGGWRETSPARFSRARWRRYGRSIGLSVTPVKTPSFNPYSKLTRFPRTRGSLMHCYPS
jgi:hypothetical protein